MTLLSAADWQSIQQRAALPQFALAFQRLRQEAASFASQPLAVQAEPGGYYHDFFCPTHGTQLFFDPTSPKAHRCPVDDAIWQGERFDAAWRWFVNNGLAESSIRMALAWRLDGNATYLKHVTQILLDYADHYARYQQVPRTVRNPGVATYTTLDESVWILPLAWAFDMIRHELAPAQIEHISRHLFAPVAEHLIAHHFGAVHNFACWHNAAVGTIGVLLNRAEWLDFAIDGEFGVNTQLREGVLADGLWFEGSFSYHYYTLAALISLAKATRHLPGLDLRQQAALRMMFLAPIQSAYPDWSLPATNDCWYFSSLLADCCHGVPPAPAFYEIAASWYDEPLFAQVLQRAYQQTPRDSLDALLFGELSLPSTSLSPLSSINLPASGYAILRSAGPEDQQTYLLLKYGPHGAGHGHPDKLNLIGYAYGQRLSPDLGTPGYGLELFESWYRQTISHNTVTLDGLSQPPATGQLHTFRAEGEFQIADASVSWQDEKAEFPIVLAYHNARMRRVILARPEYYLDIFMVGSQESRRIEWIYHNTGTPILNLSSHPANLTAGEGYGYRHVSHAQRAPVQDDFEVDWPPVSEHSAVGMKLFAAGGSAGEAITGDVPGNPPTDRFGILLHRRQATTTAFLSVFHPYQDAPAVTRVEWLGRNLVEEGWAGCVVHCAGRQEQWVIRLKDAAEKGQGIEMRPGATQFEYEISEP